MLGRRKKVGNQSTNAEDAAGINMNYMRLPCLLVTGTVLVICMCLMLLNKDLLIHQLHLSIGTSRGHMNKSACSEQFLQRHLMTSRFEGRMGNNMFQYAMLLATARRHCYTFYMNKIPSALNAAFNIPDSVIRRGTVSNLLTVLERQSGIYTPEIQSNLNKSKNLTFCCYFQSWRYFEHERELIMSAFTFQDRIKDEVSRFLRPYIISRLTCIGVHVRRGDMATLNLPYGLANITYVRNAMSYIRIKFTNRIFIIVSDDISWCNKSINGSDVTYSPFGRPALDMALLAQCDHVIITLGSFGWWGGWLSGGIVIHQAGYPVPGEELKLAEKFNTTDYYPPRWIAVN